MRRLLKRYCVVLLIFFSTFALITIYYKYFYNGYNDQGSEGLFWEALFALMLLFIVSVKYLIFDALANLMIKKVQDTTFLEAILYLGFTVAFAIDIFAIFSGLRPTTDAGLALIFAIIFSPIVLVIALVTMLLVFGFQKSRLGSPQ